MSSRPANQPSITCPRCGSVSYNRNDIAQGYCGACHWWTSDPQLMHVIECPADECHFMAFDDDLQAQVSHMTLRHPEIVKERQAESARWDGWVDEG
jgi:hypothetical protein